MEVVRCMQTMHAGHGTLISAVLDCDADVAERILSEHVALRAERGRDLVARWKTSRTPQSARDAWV
jgi:hypothetical protein